ncbi:hypothetical protein E4U53_005651 [Claviceps sorghi]|nr:hypothetical protein E4U53_005651 [Claviceps sorghi]
MALLSDKNHDFLSALSLSSSKIDLSLPFEDEFHSRLLTQQRDFENNYGYRLEAATASQDPSIQDMETTELDLAEQTAPSSDSSSADTPLISKRRHDTASSVSWNERGIVGNNHNLDDYHRGLLQLTGTDDRLFRPSFRRQNSEETTQRPRQQQQQQQQPQQQQPRRPQRRPVLHVCTTFRPKARPKNVVRPSNRYIPQSAFNRESFWIDGDEGVTPRVTLTRYDLRADEKDIYAWKGNPTYKRNAICIATSF